MANVIKSDMLAKGRKFAIAVSRFNEFLSSKLLEGCLDTLVRHGAQDSSLDVVWTPGAFELPFLAMKLAKSKKYDAVICLGAIIRGATPHFEFIASEAAKGIAKVSLDTGVPCIFGVITADNLEQAIERAGTKDGNKGRDAALSAIEMANLAERV
ncbi:MAG: 6,7-dimethyl-8-ribityllumazine synthase [Candidatus Omnitrophota bacterium]|nr:6,7-dimethyl-8-ribityllumazine synthase [Candidatus Omnitrophota bacterium]